MWIRWIVAAALAFLALHSAAYGLGFVSDPSAGAGEFGANEPATEAAENLAGLVGVLMLLMAAASTAGAVLLIRGHEGGAWIGPLLGVVLLSMGIYWGVVGRAWDFWFYTAYGLALLGGGELVRRGP